MTTSYVTIFYMFDSENDNLIITEFGDNLWTEFPQSKIIPIFI